MVLLGLAWLGSTVHHGPPAFLAGERAFKKGVEMIKRSEKHFFLEINTHDIEFRREEMVVLCVLCVLAWFGVSVLLGVGLVDENCALLSVLAAG